jgi:hypothetical protein
LNDLIGVAADRLCRGGGAEARQINEDETPLRAKSLYERVEGRAVGKQ